MSERKLPTRIISIDYGMARIGLACSDESKIIASSIGIMPASKKMEQTVLDLKKRLENECAERRFEIAEIVIGMPYMMNGTIGLLADEVTHFIDALKEVMSIPIKTWDERLTSVQAERSLREGNMSRKKRSKVVDAVAATLILQSYLDHLQFQRE